MEQTNTKTTFDVVMSRGLPPMTVVWEDLPEQSRHSLIYNGLKQYLNDGLASPDTAAAPQAWVDKKWAKVLAGDYVHRDLRDGAAPRQSGLVALALALSEGDFLPHFARHTVLAMAKKAGVTLAEDRLAHNVAKAIVDADVQAGAKAYQQAQRTVKAALAFELD
jgi:hypothetical protein